MRILSTVFFLSFLAGKFATFEQKLLTEQVFLKKRRRMRILGARIFLSFLAGKLKIFKQPLKIVKLSRLNLRTSVVVLDSGGKF